MKKQVKVLLFCMLVILMVATMVVMASAATDGATAKEDDHFYEVVDANGENPTYYTGLQAAIDAVKNNGKITVLADAEENGAIKLTHSGVSYTITGGTEMRTIAIEGGSDSTDMFTHSGSDSVTLENLTFTTTTAQWQTFIRLTGNDYNANNSISTITLNNVVANFSSKYGIWIHQTHHLTIKGEKTSIRNTTNGNFVRTNSGAAYSEINIEAGEFQGVVVLQTADTFNMTGGTLDGYFSVLYHMANIFFNSTGSYVYQPSVGAIADFVSGGYINLSGNTVINSGKNDLFSLKQPATITVSEGVQLNTNATLLGFGAESKYVYDNAVLGSSKVTLTNCTVKVSGTSSQLVPDNTNSEYVTMSGVSLTLTDGALYPTATNTAIDFSASTLVLGAVRVELHTAGNYEVRTKQDVLALITAELGDAIAATFPTDVWHGLVLNNSGIRVEVLGEALAKHADAPLFFANEGELFAPRGVDVYVAGTHFYKVEINGKFFYYKTLANAFEDLEDGGTIYLVDDAVESAPSLGYDMTYTIDGCGHILYITPANYAGSYNYPTLLHTTKGHITLKDLTLAGYDGMTPNNLIYMQNSYRDPSKVSLTLENVVIDVASTYGIWLHQEGTLIIRGENTLIRGGSTNLIRMQAGSKASLVTIEAGTFKGSASAMIEMLGSGGSMTIKGGSFTAAGLLKATAANVKLNVYGGSFTASATEAFIFNSASGTARFMGGELFASGNGIYANQLSGYSIVLTNKDEENAIVGDGKGFTIHSYDGAALNLAGKPSLVITAGTLISGEDDADGSTYNQELIKIVSRDATNRSDTLQQFEISGGTFIKEGVTYASDYTYGSVISIRMSVAEGVALNISGGTFEADYNYKTSIIGLKYDCDINISEENGEVSFLSYYPVYLGADVKANITIAGGDFLYIDEIVGGVAEAKFPSFNISGGTFTGKDLFTLHEDNSIHISGGTFTASGEGNYALNLTVPVTAENFSLTGGHFKVSRRAWVISSVSPFEIGENAAFTVSDVAGFTIGKAGEGTISSSASYKTLFEAQYPNASYTAGATLPKLQIFNDGFTLTIAGGNFAANTGETLFYICGGSIVITGGTLSALNGGVVFDIQKDGTTVSVTGGRLIANGKNSYLFKYAYDVKGEDFSATGGTFEIRNKAHAPVIPGATFTAAITIYDISELEINTQNPNPEYDAVNNPDVPQYLPYVLNQQNDLAAFAEAQLKTYFPNVTVSMTKFVPVIMNCADATLIINAGTYSTDDCVLFTVKAGTVQVVDGTFNVTNGGKIFELDGGTLTIDGGTFTVKAFETDNKGIVIDAIGSDSVLTVNGGTFTAARIVNVTAKVAATINGGAFTSNALLLDGAYMIHLASPERNSTVTINGGTFTGNAKTKAILAATTACFNLGTNAYNIAGGVFDGGCWIHASQKIRININANTDAAKNPVFKDSGKLIIEVGAPAHIWLDPSEDSVPTLNINAGTLTTSSYVPMVETGKSKVTVKGGTLQGGKLFHITSNTSNALTVSNAAAELIADGAGAYIFKLDDGVSTSAVKISAGKFTVKNGAFIEFEHADLFKKATSILIKSVAGWELTEAGTYTVTTPGQFTNMAAAYAATKFAGTGWTAAVTIELDNVWMPVTVNNADITLIFAEGTYITESDYFVNLVAGNLQVIDGTYDIYAGHFIMMSGSGSVTIGGATTTPAIKIAAGYNLVRANGVKGAEITVNSGVISKVGMNRRGEFTATVIDLEDENGNGPLFYFYGDCAGAVLTINGGTFTAARILKSLNTGMTVNLNGGVFKSTFKENNFAGGVMPAIDHANFFEFVGNATLTVTGGDLDSGIGRAIFSITDADAFEISFAGGSFAGSNYWIISDCACSINIENTVLPDNSKTVPTFSDPYASVKYGIYLTGDVEMDLKINGGHFSTAAGHIVYFTAPANVDVSEGTFWIDPSENNPGVVLYPNNKSGSLVINGGTFYGARMLHLAVAMTVTINDGTFYGNSINSSGTNYAHFLRVYKSGAKLIINGGHYIGNNQIYSLLTLNASGAAAEIYGGKFEGGMYWIVANSTVTLTIDKHPSGDPEKNPYFGDMSIGSKSYGIYLAKDAPNSLIHIKAGTFELTSECEGSIIRSGGGMKVIIEKDVVMTSSGRIIYGYDSYQSNVIIRGGTFKVTGNGVFCYYRFGNHSGGTYPGQLLIEDGEFIAEEAGALFQFGARDKRAKLIVRGGKFTSESGRMIYMFGSDSKGQFLIEGGYWETTGNRMIYVEECVEPLHIKDGTFVFAHKGNSLKNLENALIYVAARGLASEIVIEGGTFIDERKASQQTVLKQNPKAKITFAGDVRFFVKEKKAFFLYDADDPMNKNIASSELTPKSKLPEGCLYESESNYYVYSHYQCAEFAPAIHGAPTLRANLGDMGIRFTSTVLATTAAELAKLGTVSYGTVIFKTSSLPSYESGADIIALLKEKNAKYEDVVAQNGLITDASGNITIHASLINIKAEHYGEAFTGIAYAKVVAADGTVTYYYSTHIDASANATLQGVAYNALNDVAQNPSMSDDGRVFCFTSVYVNGYMSRYTFRQQEEMRALLPKDLQVPKTEE